VTAPASARRGEVTAPDGRSVAAEWRREYPVMVAEAQAVGSVGVIRSLGRAGYQVHTVSDSSEALGLRSRFAARSAVSPAYPAPDFVSWLRGYVRDYGIRAIVPSEGFLFAVRDTWSEFV